MRKHLYCGMIAAIALVPMASPAADPPATPAGLAELGIFLGHWSCSGKAMPPPDSKEHATKAVVYGSKAVGGRWLHLTYDERKSKANPSPYHVGVYLGYDTAKKDFVLNCVDNTGGYCTEHSTGWSGDTIVFEGTGNADGRQFGSRDTFVRQGTHRLTHTGAMQGSDQKWSEIDQETCRRSK